MDITEKAKEIAELLNLLGNQNRLLILCHLLNGEHNVSELNEKIPNLSQSGLSQHLLALKARNIIDSEKHGLNVIYYIKDVKIKAVMEVLKQNYCV